MEDKLKTTIISFYGGPGAGKSTSAAYMYYLLKAAGENTELVREYVKNWAWEGRKFNTYDQLYFLGKQIRQESLLFGKVKFLITDAPIFMNVFYADKYCPPTLAQGIRSAVMAFQQQTEIDGFKHYHILLERQHQYAAEGRYQTEAEASQMHDELKKMLQDLKVPGLITCPSNENSLKELFDLIMREKNW